MTNNLRRQVLDYGKYVETHPFDAFMGKILDSFDHEINYSHLATNKTFEHNTRLKPALEESIRRVGWNYLSKVQEYCLGTLCADPPQNMVIRGQSGSGKTAAMAIAILNRIDTTKQSTQAIFAATTIETACQFAEILFRLGEPMNVSVRLVIQGKKLVIGNKSNEHIIVATPKELASFRVLGGFEIDEIVLAVFDDADLIVTSDIVQRHLLIPLLEKCQVVLSSTTIGQHNIAQAINVNIQPEEELPSNLTIFFYVCNGNLEKFSATRLIIDGIHRKFNSGGIIIFCNKRENVRWLKFMLGALKYNVQCIKGDMSTDDRLMALHKFKQGDSRILLATNLISRGVDVPSVKLVINFDIPVGESGEVDRKSFLHRVGRAGRFGRKAAAVTLVDHAEAPLMRQLATNYNRSVQIE